MPDYSLNPIQQNLGQVTDPSHSDSTASLSLFSIPNYLSTPEAEEIREMVKKASEKMRNEKLFSRFPAERYHYPLEKEAK